MKTRITLTVKWVRFFFFLKWVRFCSNNISQKLTTWKLRGNLLKPMVLLPLDSMVASAPIFLSPVSLSALLPPCTHLQWLLPLLAAVLMLSIVTDTVFRIFLIFQKRDFGRSFPMTVVWQGPCESGHWGVGTVNMCRKVYTHTSALLCLQVN